MNENDERVDEALVRRVIAAVHATSIDRYAIEFDYPECHKRGCQQQHRGPEAALTTMMVRISENVRSELGYRTTTQPDVFGVGGRPEDRPVDAKDVAVCTLAVLMRTYNVHKTSTFDKAAQLIVEAYPGLVEALTAPYPHVLADLRPEGVSA